MSGKTTPAVVSEVATPCFLVDVDRLKDNADRMLDTCRRLKVDLRPHTKTHKTVEAADMLTGGTRRKIACSTLAECEMYADNGFDDILLAFPITSYKIPRCVALANRLEEFHVLLSDVDGLRCLQDGASVLAAGKVWSVFLEVDAGYGRTGIPIDSEAIVKTGLRIEAEPCLRLQGLYNHCGQAYQLMTETQRQQDQNTLVNKMTRAAERLRSSGVAVPVVGTGSTPTCSLASPVLSALNEFHPGNYVFYDYEHVLLGACREDQVACCVATRVVSTRPDLGMLVVDCGFLALGHDGIHKRPQDFCLIKDHPHLRLVGMTQELGKIRAKEGQTIHFDRYPVGTLLFIVPYHSCCTAAMHQRYLVHSGPKITGAWTPVKGW